MHSKKDTSVFFLPSCPPSNIKTTMYTVLCQRDVSCFSTWFKCKGSRQSQSLRLYCFFHLLSKIKEEEKREEKYDETIKYNENAFESSSETHESTVRQNGQVGVVDLVVSSRYA